MPLYDALKRLARLPRSSAPFLSLYLNARWDNEKQREKVRIFVKTRLKECVAGGNGGGEAGGARQDAEKIDHYVKGLVNREWDETYRGIGVLACSHLGVYQVLRSHEPFDDFFACADRPILRPAVEKARAGENALLAMVSGDGGRLLALESGGIRREFSFRDEEFPGRHEQGGWSQARYQRHVDEHMSRNFKRLANRLVTWCDELGGAPLLLSGQEPVLAAFEPHLPRRVTDSICDRLHIDPSATVDEVTDQASRALKAALSRQDRAAVDQLLDRKIGGGRGVVGVDAVAAAVASGKVHALYVGRGFNEIGWKCFQCGALGVQVPLGCPLCGKDVEDVELGEELTRGTLSTDGRVVFVDDHDGLRESGGVGATLRY